MTRAVVFVAAAMVAASLGVVAQDNSGTMSNQPRENNNAPRNVVVTGCLNTSASGNFIMRNSNLD